MTADISVVVLFGDGRPLGPLLELLRSIDEQTEAPGEVVVVLNGAPSAVGKRLKAKAPLRVIACEDDRGCPQGRNFGAHHASKEILLFVDDDGMLEPNAVATVVAALADRRWFGVAGRVVDVSHRAHSLPKRDASNIATMRVSGGIFAVRRRAFLEIGGYWERRARQGEELDLALRSAKLGYRTAFRPDLILFHPIRPMATRGESLLAQTEVSQSIAFIRSFPLPLAICGAVWKCGRHAARLGLRRQTARLWAFFGEARREFEYGYRTRNPLPWRLALQSLLLLRRSPDPYL